MKLLKLILSAGSSFGLVGIWKHLVNIIATVLFLFVVYLTINTAWNGVTYANKHYKKAISARDQCKSDNDSLKNMVDNQQFEINDLYSTMARMRNDSVSLKRRIADDSVFHKKQIEQLQILIKEINAGSKAKDSQIIELQSGLMCKVVKVGLLGKKTITFERCED